MNMTIATIDDETHALSILHEYIRSVPGLTLVGSYTDPLQALTDPNISTADLIFADVDMPELSGLELAKLLKPASLLIFTTAFRQYGPEAYELSATDYLLKPFSFERFLQSIQKARTALQKLAVNQIKEQSYFFVQHDTRGRYTRVEPREIVYVEVTGHYSNLQLTDQKLSSLLTLAEVLEKLPVDDFMRVHRSFIINKRHVRTVEQSALKMSNNSLVPFSRAYKAAVLDMIQSALLNSRPPL